MVVFSQRGVTQEDSRGVTLNAPAARLRPFHLTKERVRGKWPTPHGFQLMFSNFNDSSAGVILFDFPAEHTHRHHEEERGEEDREEHKQIDLRQVLSEIHQASTPRRVPTNKH